MILNDKRLTAKWYKANIKRRFEQAERMLLFLEYPRNDVQLDGDYMFVPVRCKSESGVFYYYSECSELFLPTFVFHFLTALQLNALQPCKCRGCGNLFCGKTEEISCSKVACKKKAVLTTEEMRQKELNAIIGNYQNTVRQDRYKMRDDEYPETAVEEFNTIAKKYEIQIKDKVAELKRQEATLEEIRAAQEMVKNTYFVNLLEEVKRIREKYSQ